MHGRSAPWARMKQAPSGTRLRSTRSGWSGTAFLSQSSGLGNEGVGKFGYSSDIKKLRPAAFWDIPQIWGTWPRCSIVPSPREAGRADSPSDVKSDRRCFKRGKRNADKTSVPGSPGPPCRRSANPTPLKKLSHPDSEGLSGRPWWPAGCGRHHGLGPGRLVQICTIPA